MTTINVSDSTRKRFNQAKLKESAEEGYNISSDEFLDKLLDKWDEKK